MWQSISTAPFASDHAGLVVKLRLQ